MLLTGKKQQGFTRQVSSFKGPTNTTSAVVAASPTNALGIYIHTYIHTHASIYTYIHAYIHTHTYIHKGTSHC